MNMEGKLEIVRKALALGIINDPCWLERLEEPMPAWVVFEIILKAMEKIDPPGISYD